MNPILAQVISFLNEANKGPVAMDDRLIDEFGETCKKIIRKQFTDQREKSFRIRMSNIGRPLCQLQNEASGVAEEASPYSQKMSNTFGDMVEALAILIMKSANVNIQNEQQKVVLDIGGIALEGTLDVEIDDVVYDVKSTSSFAFDRKFGPDGGFGAIAASDDFGYVTQGYLYGEAYEKPFGGWIAINKASGEWNVVETPNNSEEYHSRALAETEEKINALLMGQDFAKCFEDEPEKYRRKETGNRVLPFACGWCKFKKNCWPNVVYTTQKASTAQNPKYVYYSEIKNGNQNSEQEGEGKAITELGSRSVDPSSSELPPWE